MTHNENSRNARDNDLQYLTLEEIRLQLEEFTIDQLRAFADRSEVRDYAGAVPNPRTRGVMWPPDAVPVLAHLVAQRVAGKLEPKNVKGYLSDLVSIAIGQPARSPDPAPERRDELARSLSGGALVKTIGQSPRLPDVRPDDWIEAANVFKAALGVAADLSREIAQIQRLPRIVDDCVFDAIGAAEYLCCSVRLLRRSVQPSFRLGSSQAGDRWYRRDLLGLKGGDR
jgi:hypothetical protein